MFNELYLFPLTILVKYSISFHWNVLIHKTNPPQKYIHCSKKKKKVWQLAPVSHVLYISSFTARVLLIRLKLVETCHLWKFPKDVIIRIDIFPEQLTWNIFLARFQFGVRLWFEFSKQRRGKKSPSGWIFVKQGGFIFCANNQCYLLCKLCYVQCYFVNYVKVGFWINT